MKYSTDTMSLKGTPIIVYVPDRSSMPILDSEIVRTEGLKSGNTRKKQLV